MNSKPKKGEYLEILLRSPKTIFSANDAALLWGESKEKTVTSRLNSYAQAGKLVRLRRGVYAKDAAYNPLELATRIYTPSYISFETILTREGVNFQYYQTLFVASYLSREIVVDGQKISYVRMKDYVLSNTAGINHTEGVAIATPERAFLDKIYTSREYHLDNPGMLDWDVVFALLPIYQNQKMAARVQKYFDHYKSTL